jgi:hypothetical protein
MDHMTYLCNDTVLLGYMYRQILKLVNFLNKCILSYRTVLVSSALVALATFPQKCQTKHNIIRSN